MFIVDAHEDIAWNALTFRRDYNGSALAIRSAEARTEIPRQNGLAMLGRPEWLLGRVGVVFGTLFVAPCRSSLGAWDTQCYRDAAEAHKLAQAQLDYYHRLADEEELFTIIRTTADLDAVIQSWDSDDLALRRIGIVVLMEGADPISEPAEAEYWFEQGVRLIGPAWTGTRYSGGTGQPGPLTPLGHELLDVMADLGVVLDLSHLSEESFDQALDRFEGVAIASHANPRRMADLKYPERALTDAQIRALAARDGVIGVVPFNRFLRTLWTATDGKQAVTVQRVADAIDHIFQVTGSSAHAGIGSDFDGGFGAESTPAEIDTVADLQTIAGALHARGYAADDVERVMSANWLRVLREGLPAGG
ncbi:MAG: dipeptidase [Anaerolineales bacterium]